MKKLVVLLLSLCFLFTSNAMAEEMCPSKTRFVKLVAYDNNYNPIHTGVLHVAPQQLPGTEDVCPNEDVVASMLEMDRETKSTRIVPVILEKGAVSNPVNLLTDEEIKLFQEKGIKPTPKDKIEPNQKPRPAPKGAATASVSTDTLSSSIY